MNLVWKHSQGEVRLGNIHSSGIVWIGERDREKDIEEGEREVGEKDSAYRELGVFDASESVGGSHGSAHKLLAGSLSGGGTHDSGHKLCDESLSDGGTHGSAHKLRDDSLSDGGTHGSAHKLCGVSLSDGGSHGSAQRLWDGINAGASAEKIGVVVEGSSTESKVESGTGTGVDTARCLRR